MAVKWHMEEQTELFLVCADLLLRLWLNTMHSTKGKKKNMLNWVDVYIKYTWCALMTEGFKIAEISVKLEASITSDWRWSLRSLDVFGTVSSWIHTRVEQVTVNLIVSGWPCRWHFHQSDPFELAWLVFFTFCWSCNHSIRFVELLPPFCSHRQTWTNLYPTVRISINYRCTKNVIEG